MGMCSGLIERQQTGAGVIDLNPGFVSRGHMTARWADTPVLPQGTSAQVGQRIPKVNVAMFLGCSGGNLFTPRRHLSHLLKFL